MLALLCIARPAFVRRESNRKMRSDSTCAPSSPTRKRPNAPSLLRMQTPPSCSAFLAAAESQLKGCGKVLDDFSAQLKTDRDLDRAFGLYLETERDLFGRSIHDPDVPNWAAAYAGEKTRFDSTIDDTIQALRGAGIAV